MTNTKQVVTSVSLSRPEHWNIPCPKCLKKFHGIHGLNIHLSRVHKNPEQEWDEKSWTKGFLDLMSELGISQDKRYKVEEFIRDLLAKKEAEYEKVRNGLHRYYIRANNKSLEQLKQQHRAEIEKAIVDSVKEIIEHPDSSPTLINEIDRILRTKLLNSQKGSI